MHPFSIHEIIFPAFCIFLITFIITFSYTKSFFLSIFSSFFKFIIFFIYFVFYFDGTYNFLDDWVYYQEGIVLLQHHVTLFNLPQNWQFLLSIGGGQNVLYYLYNTYAFKLFGIGYYAPVALNVILTGFIAYIGTRLVEKEFKLKGDARILFFLFLLFYPDILAWSNVMNGKDILVLLLELILIASISYYLRGKIFRSLLIGIPIGFMLFFTRFYAIFLISLALLLANLWGSLTLRKVFFLIFSFFIVFFIFHVLGIDAILLSYHDLLQKFVNPLYGFFRFLLTPIPFHAEQSYAFLNLPSLFHWLMIPFLILGIIYIYHVKTPFSRFFLSYFFIFVILYSVYGELQGPRHRVQLDYCLAVFQFYGFMWVLRSLHYPNRPISLDSKLEYT